jgi:hypothetical protein
LGSPSSTAIIDRPLMTKRLKAAEPTIVEGPSGDGMASISYTVLMTLNKISGAEDPNAISVKLATVSFQNGTSMKNFYFYSSSQISMVVVCDVIYSIASMNISDIIAIPTNIYTKLNK